MDNPDKLFPTEDAAERLGSKPATMQWWRAMGRGPRYVKIGRRVLYRASDLDAFVEQGVREPEAA